MAGSRRQPIVKDPQAALWLGVGFYLLGTLFLWDAHEGRGKERPFILRWLPGA